MASAISALTGGSNSSSAASTTPSIKAPSEQMFLQLLVSQLQNQDPLNPADSTQFVAELAQFSELEQVIAIRGDIENKMASGATAAGASTAASGAPGGTAATGTTNPNHSI